MVILNTGERQVPPTHPGEMLREDFLPDYGLSVASLARALGVSRQTINELLRERRSLSAELGLRLARLFGNSPEFWLNAQRAVDLWQARQSLAADELDRELPPQTQPGKATREREFPVFHSAKPGSLALTNAEIAQAEAEEDRRRLGLAG